MIVKSLVLQNFRNLSDRTFDFSGGVTGFLGDNGQGKTNVLEALYLLSSGSSWRTSTDNELVSYEASYARIDGTITAKEASDSLALVIEKHEDTTRVKKSYLVNGVRRKKETFAHYLPTVLFYPEDISLISGSPALRRKALDHCLSQVFPRYSYVLSQYGKVVVARNRILESLRERTAQLSQLEYWTSTLVQLGAELYQFRFSFFEFLQNFPSEYLVEYHPKIECYHKWCETHELGTISHLFDERIKHNLQKEIMSGMTQYGPHKDDFIFFLGGRDLSSFGSRGEQRGGVLAFKKMQLHYVEHVRNEKPVILLDDIFSEFDRGHRKELSTLVAGYQTFITGTEEQFFLHEDFKFDTVFTVKKGELYPCDLKNT